MQDRKKDMAIIELGGNRDTMQAFHQAKKNVASAKSNIEDTMSIGIQ